MIRLLSGIFLCFMSFLAYALDETPKIPATSADPTAMIVTVFILVGVVVGFIVYIWRNEQKRKQQETAAK